MDSTHRFAEKIREQVLSTDYDVLYVPPLSEFDTNVMKTQGPAPKGKSLKNAKVLCTTELGLLRRTNRAKAGDGKGQGVETEYMSKATVIFEHEMEGF